MRRPTACFLAVLSACCPPTPAKVAAPPAAPPTAPAPPVTVAPPAPKPEGPVPPVAERRPYQVPSPNGTREDPYYWLRDDTRKDPAVLGYLAAENAYTKAVMAPYAATEDALFAEMKSRVKEDDSSVPQFDNGYWYYARFETGKQYPIHARRKGTMQAPEQIVLDGNQLAEGKPFFAIGTYSVSRDGKLVAWADDTVGRNQFALHVKDIATGKLYSDTATNMAPRIAWANDNKTLFFVGKDDKTLREDRVYRHVLGGTDELAYKEDDASYYVSLAPSKSHRYVMFIAEATTNSEVRLADADKPATAPVVFIPRGKDHIYGVDHLGNRFVMRTNEGGKNFRLVEIPSAKTAADRKTWKEIIPHRADTLLEDFALYNTFIATTIRTGGLRKVSVLPTKGAAFLVDAPDPSYAMTVIDTPDPASKRVRYAYDSMVTPSSVFEIDVATKKKELLKQQPVPGYDASLYATEYLHATAADGTQVPISVVYKKTTPRDGSAPLLLYGYGSYGISMEPRQGQFVSLLDRGWVYAIAHIRGGQEMGRAWYEDGKLLKKMNTFTDFNAAAEFLVAQKLAKRDQVFAMGGSAGGLLMGAIANLRPDLYRGIVAQVPFVDVVTTMLDESIPLTTNEFDEWGNPKEKGAYENMLSYSPYDNVKAQAYPSIYVKSGLWDSQVQYYEPAKWVAKLRATKTDKNLLVFDVDMTSGHGGASGRFNRLRDLAKAFSFVLAVHERPDQR